MKVVPVRNIVDNQNSLQRQKQFLFYPEHRYFQKITYDLDQLNALVHIIYMPRLLLFFTVIPVSKRGEGFVFTS